MLINQRETAIHSHNHIIKEDVKPTQKQRILDAFIGLGRLSDKNLSDITGIKLNLIPDRRGELLREGKIHEAGVFKDPQTKRPVIYYRVNKTPDLFPIKKKSMQKRKAEIVELCERDGGALAKTILEIIKG